jgi:uncharacterized surface protein with fasciclin (FAS1) repeats
MSTSLPPLDTIKHLLERLKANDVAWFRERYKAGDLAWLKDRLPAGGYEKLGERIEAGDLGWLRERIATLPGMNIPGLNLASYGLGGVGSAAGAVSGVATGALKGAVGAGAAGSAAAMATGRKRGLWFIPILILAAIIAALLLKQCGNDDEVATDDTELVAEETEAATETSVAEETAAVETEAAVAETTVAAPAETTVAAAGTDIVATAQAAGNFSTLTAALGAAGLTETLQGAGPFTVFAPTDEAFAKLPPGAVDALLKPENKPVLEQILKYHVVAGNVKAADVKTGPVPSVEGTNLDLTAADGKVTVNGANVTTADVASSNGVIHVIDSVLIPASVDVPALLAGAAAPATEAAAPATEAAAPTTEAAAVNAAGDAVPEDLTVYFANGSFRLDAAAQAKIDAASAILAKLPPGSVADVVGHASATGNPAKNQQLSEQRANEVIAALKRQLGDNAAKIEFTASAKGDQNPIENEDKSRRVTIQIKK